ncbi:unnamed protein product [Miscanthus lutarioriparius]|uniref:Protein kinase domain-containing protein n=1 Tax=Miscanthus lutarioriparius TaxID=422564 RepID=A0A811S4T9_9POAL|nr:unnamed protein product [Miscanthus lutarioriparius]
MSHAATVTRFRAGEAHEAATASPLVSPSGLWTVLGQASNVAQLVGVDALGLVSMVVPAALAARRHRDACRRLAQHVDIVGGLLREMELAELMRREATRRPLQQLHDALRRCYALVTAYQDCGYLRNLFLGARMAEELRAVEQEIDMFIRLVPLIALVDTTHERRAAEAVPVLIMNGSSHHHVRFPISVEDFTRIQVQGAPKIYNVAKQSFAGAMDLQGQKILDTEELLELCTHTEESCSGFRKFEFSQIVNATDTFSEDRNVGWGGFAKVYKGELPDGLMIAVKRLNEHAAVYDFTNEFLLARLEHINLVRLLGWCIHGKERILVYELMHKGGLHQFIFVVTKLQSMHLEAFIQSVVISGRKNIILEHQGDTVGNLVRDAWQLWHDGRLHELVDPILGDGFELAEVKQYAQVALLCTQEDPADRPTMSDVTALLNFESISLLPDPKQPSELNNGGATGDKLSTYVHQSSRTINITITSSAPVSTRICIIVEPEA